MPDQRDQRFPSINRLNRAMDFRRVFSKGKRTATRLFVIYILPNHLSHSRLGIQVQSKIGTAVQRNYIKRIVREIFRKIHQDFREPVDIVFIAGKQMKNVRFSEFNEEFLKVVQRYLR
ncbi:MAG TPA: ribonuclease P protein component [Acidobacteriota bacterium]|jgi:ribonuclease P protein component|nr:ribonuclease P protein component [Acidobacteriota bacterium]